MSLYLLALAIAPGIAICFYIYFKDKYEKEPIKLLISSFLLGCCSVLTTLLLSGIATYLFAFDPRSSNLYFSLVSCVVGIGLVEEYSKFIFVRYYSYRNKAFNEPFDGIVYCVMVSMGFATVENILYVYDGGSSVAWLRMFTAVPMHAVFAIVMGYYLGVQKHLGGRVKAIMGLIYAILLHGLYDFVLMYPGIHAGLKILSFFACLFFGFRFARKAIRVHQESSPFKGFQ
jgi:RsiW-degrading membrane proteinase PrsW (M82 family)